MTNLNSVKAIFFDAGGTLIHLDAPLICSLLTDKFGSSLSTDRFPHAQSLAMQRVAQLVAEGAGSTEQLKRQFYSTLLPVIGVEENHLEQAIDLALGLAKAEMLWRITETSTASALAQLKERGFRLAVVSNSDGRIELAFRQAGLFDYFEFFIDSFLVGVEKPDPRIFQIALGRAGVAPHEAIYVGDLYSVDVVGARAAELIPVLYDPYALNKETDCLKIQSIGDLITLLG
jgi:putative hydrolase of the HAD superfamily